MCLAAIALDVSLRFPLVVAANRDEFFERPADPLDWWTPEGHSQPILGGRDRQAGGTWMGLSRSGRLAIVTNVRQPGPAVTDGPSRGGIVPAWLGTTQPADRFWTQVALSGHAPFNLVAADFQRRECFWASNVVASARRLDHGVTVVSNAASLEAPWPKVQRLRGGMAQLLKACGTDTVVDDLAGRLFTLLADRTQAADEELPDTGLPRERERWLSSAFIASPDGRYGTRCSTVVVTERTGRQWTTHVWERSFGADGEPSLLRRATVTDWPPA